LGQDYKQKSTYLRSVMQALAVQGIRKKSALLESVIFV